MMMTITFLTLALATTMVKFSLGINVEDNVKSPSPLDLDVGEGPIAAEPEGNINGDDSLLDILREVNTSSLPECENTVSCVAARLRLSSLLLDHITVVGKTLSKVNQLSEDPESWEYEDNNGTEAVLTWMGDEMYGHTNLGHGNMFVIEPTMTDKMLVLKEKDTSTSKHGDDVVEEEVEMRDAMAPAPHLVEQGLADRTTMRAGETTAPPDPDLVKKGKEDKTKLATFTVTVYITKEFKRKVENPKLYINNKIAETNQGYIKSGALIRIALHCIQDTDIGDGQSPSKTLQDFTNLGPAAYIRKSADTAILLVYKFMSVCYACECGKNNVDQIGSGKTLGVVSKECDSFDYNFAHEIAHGLGLGHEKRNGESSTDYSHGKVFKQGWYGYRTIMATPSYYERAVNYYSSPNARYQGLTTGTATEDNVRVLNERRFAAAAIGDESFYCQLGITDNTDTETCIRDIYEEAPTTVISGYNYQYEELNSNNITLEVKATNDIHISFAAEKKTDGQNLNEIVIGGWSNQQSVIRRGMQGSNLAKAQTPSVLSNEEFRGFWITSVIIDEGREISVGKIGEENPFMSGIDNNPLNWSYIGLGCWHGVTCSYKYVDHGTKVCVVVGVGINNPYWQISEAVIKKWSAEGYKVAGLSLRGKIPDSISKIAIGYKFKNNPTSVKKVVRAIEKELGPIHMLFIVNRGVSNLRWFTQQVSLGMMERNTGFIIVTSPSSDVKRETDILAEDLVPKGVNVLYSSPTGSLHAQDVAQSYWDVGQTTGCLREDNVDYYGSDITGNPKPIVTGPAACNNLCVQNIACTHWSFGKDNKECYLKNSDSRKNKHNNRISGPKCSTARGPELKKGNYVRHPPTNDWHYVTISQDKDGVYKWTNRAGVTWTLYHESDDNTLRVGDDCPYYRSPYNHRTATFNEDGIFGPHDVFYSYESGESRKCKDGGKKENCKASCLNEAVCQKKNDYQSCFQMKQQGFCDNSKYKTFMMDHCRASCLCGYLPKWYLKSECSDIWGTDECQRRAKDDGSGCFSNSKRHMFQEDREMVTNCYKTCVCNTKADDMSLSWKVGK